MGEMWDRAEKAILDKMLDGGEVPADIEARLGHHRALEVHGVCTQIQQHQAEGGKTVEKKEVVTLQCEIHGEYSGEKITLSLLGQKEMEFNPMCPICEKEREAEEKRQQAEDERQRNNRRMQAMNIEPRYYDVTLENFETYNDELRKHLEICRAFVEKPDGKLVMIGENGNGKTHLAVSILKKLGGAIYTAYEIGIKLRQSYGGDTKEWEVFDELCTVPLLVIDEVEKIKDSESKQNWVSYVVGKRYDRLLPIIFIGNCHTSKDCKAQHPPCNRCLEHHLENDVLSRIIEDGIIMKFSNSDYRKKIKVARFKAQEKNNEERVCKTN